MLPVVSAVSVAVTLFEVLIGLGVLMLVAQRFPDNTFSQALAGIFGGN